MNRESTLYKAVLLGGLCAICGLALSGVNSITAPLIAAATLAKEQANLEQIYPGATFKEITDYEDTTGYVTGVYEAEGLGTIYKLQVTGYNSSGFTFMLAYNEDGSIAGFTPIEQNETAGFGSRCFEDDYVNEVLSLSATDKLPLLTGATLTSNAIRNGGIAASALFTGGEAVVEDSTPEAPVYTLSSDYSQYEPSCEEVSNDGATAVYACSAKGFGLVLNAGTDYKNNEANITVDLDTMTIAGIELTQFGDTKGIGNDAVTDEALASFEGLSLEEGEVDLVSTASWTGRSIAAMAQVALQAAGE